MTRELHGRVERVEALLAVLDRGLPIAPATLDAAGLVDGWRIIRGGTNHTHYVDTPRRPVDPVVPWAVAPSEHVTHSAGELVAVLVANGWREDAHDWLDRHQQPRAPALELEYVDRIEAFLDQVDAIADAPSPISVVVSHRGWKADRFNTWHRCGGFHDNGGALAGMSSAAPPTGSFVCPACLRL